MVPHRRAIGGAVLHGHGGVVITGHNVARKHGQVTTVLLANERRSTHTHFNDLCTDGVGRIYVGLVDLDAHRSDRRRARSIISLIDTDGSVQVVDEFGVDAANGIAPSIDGRLLYVCDTFGETVWQFDVHTDGTLANRRPLVHWDERAGPDGLALTESGDICVALHFAGCVALIDPDGAEKRRLAVPGPPTSVCFGGTSLDVLYITTASSPGERNGGAFSVLDEGPGNAVPLAAVRGESGS